MKTRKEIEDRIALFMTNIRKGLSYDANVVLLTNDIEEAISQGQTLPTDSVRKSLLSAKEVYIAASTKFPKDFTKWYNENVC